jgi:4-diphosphocytidyl-2-C-methyl-D-erythritol kinase
MSADRGSILATQRRAIAPFPPFDCEFAAFISQMTWTGSTAVVRAPAKINLCLRVTGRRDDGFHLLDSLVAPITLFDHLTLRAMPSQAVRVSLRCDPPGTTPLGAQNLAVRAAEAFLRENRLTAQVDIALDKQIPVGAGLGGGSSDAAAVLRGLNALLQRPLALEALTALAPGLGADVPLFLAGGPVRMQGIGERLAPCHLAILHPIVVAFAGVPLDTRTVYAKYDDLLTKSEAISSIPPLTLGREPLRSVLHNDLEAAAFHVQPAVLTLKQRLCSLGAEGVLMTGSGSAVFGYWQNWDDANTAAQRLRTAGIWTRIVKVLDRIPDVELIAQ